jgi:hypothetical protein
MLDVKSVFNLAAKNDFYELADFVSEKPKEYSNFILIGKE